MEVHTLVTQREKPGMPKKAVAGFGRRKPNQIEAHVYKLIYTLQYSDAYVSSIWFGFVDFHSPEESRPEHCVNVELVCPASPADDLAFLRARMANDYELSDMIRDAGRPVI